MCERTVSRKYPNKESKKESKMLDNGGWTSIDPEPAPPKTAEQLLKEAQEKRKKT